MTSNTTSNTTPAKTLHTYMRGELADVASMYGEFTAVRVLGRTREDGYGHQVWVKVTARTSTMYRCGEIITVSPTSLWPKRARYYVPAMTMSLPVVDGSGDTHWQCFDGGIDHIQTAATMAWLMDPYTDLSKTDVVDIEWLEPLNERDVVRQVTIHTRTPSGRETIRTYVRPE